MSFSLHKRIFKLAKLAGDNEESSRSIALRVVTRCGDQAEGMMEALRYE